MRLDRLLSHGGHGSRAEVRALVMSGRVSVFGRVARDAGLDVQGAEGVLVDGKPCGFRERFHIMMNKPAGVVTATTDPKEKTVLDLMEERHRKSGVVPVGRLDKDVTGLLLLTDDGTLAHRLTSPKHGAKKVYEALVDGHLTARDVEAFASGMSFSDFTALPALLEILAAGEQSLARVTVGEGKYHQVKRMFAKVGSPVIVLKRVSVAGVTLDESLAPGEYRDLTEEEIRMIGR